MWGWWVFQIEVSILRVGMPGGGVEYVQIGRVGTQPTLDMGPPRGYPPGY